MTVSSNTKETALAHPARPSDLPELTKRNSLIGGSDDEDEYEDEGGGGNGGGGDVGKVRAPASVRTGVGKWNSNMQEMRMVCDFKAHKERLATVAVSADKLWIFSASHDNVLKMYSLEEMSNVRTVSIGTRNISCCLPLPNNQTVLLGSWDHSICAYSVSFFTA